MKWEKIVEVFVTIAYCATLVAMIFVLHGGVVKFDKKQNIAHAQEFHQEKYRGAISITPKPAYGYRDIEYVCLSGVKYYILTSRRGPFETSMTPAIMPDGKPELCQKQSKLGEANDNVLP